eukprot:365238-Chlamydomonas_euryale.AAC.3
MQQAHAITRRSTTQHDVAQHGIPQGCAVKAWQGTAHGVAWHGTRHSTGSSPPSKSLSSAGTLASASLSSSSDSILRTQAATTFISTAVRQPSGR